MLHAHCAWEYESVVEREMFWMAVTRSKRRQIQKVQDQVLEMLTTFWKPALCEASVAAACSVSTLCAAELSWPDMDSVMAMFPIPKTYCKRKKKLQLTKKGMNICFSYRMLVLTKQHCWNKVIERKGCAQTWRTMEKCCWSILIIMNHYLKLFLMMSWRNWALLILFRVSQHKLGVPKGA